MSLEVSSTLEDSVILPEPFGCSWVSELWCSLSFDCGVFVLVFQKTDFVKPDFSNVFPHLLLPQWFLWCHCPLVELLCCLAGKPWTWMQVACTKNVAQYGLKQKQKVWNLVAVASAFCCLQLDPSALFLWKLHSEFHNWFVNLSQQRLTWLWQ